MLAGARLGNDALFPHAFREQRLRERVVDLVRAGVEQVLAFEINFCPAAMLRQPLRKIQLGGPAGELLEMMPQFFLKHRIFAHQFVSRRELGERRHQGLGDKDSAIRTEMSGRIRQLAGNGGRGRGAGGRHEPIPINCAAAERKRDFSRARRTGTVLR